jgi:peptidoglycan/LPS O-acetylase OafA/YrhL
MRGFFALVVALGHFRAAGHYYPMDLAGNAYTIVDLFFVLSGFVIAHVTRHGLADARGAAVFMLRRFGRVWPAHVVVLGFYVALELLKLRAELTGNLSAGRHAFAPDSQFAVSALPANLALVQSLSIFPRATWNVPSWSISTELYTYVLFTFCTVVLRGRLLIVSVLFSIASLFYVYTHAPNMNVTFDYGFPRTVVGFFAGHMTYQVWRKLPPLPRSWATPAELVCALTLLLFFSLAGHSQLSILAPLVCVGPIFVFASDAGLVSKALMTGPLQALGRWSYSIYLVHELVYLVLTRGLNVLSKRTGLSFFTELGTWYDGTPIQVISFGGVWTMDALTVSMLALVSLISAGMYRWIEVPCQRPFQQLARRVDATRAARQKHALEPVASAEPQ